MTDTKFRDPIHQGENNKWFFWDETWSFEEGPYETEAEARTALDVYWKEQLGL